MKQTAILRFFFALLPMGLSAQINLHGTLVNHPGDRIRQLSVEYWNTDHWQQASGGAINPDNTFEVAMPISTPGQYRFRLFGEAKVWSDFILPDSSMRESSMSFALDYKQMDGSPTKVIGSKANELYYDLMMAEKQLHQDDAPKNAVSDFNRRCMDIVRQYRKTLIGDIALLFYQPQKEDFPGNVQIEKMTANEFAKAHALDKIPFEHDNILNHNGLAKALNAYYNYFEHNEKGDNAFIDGVMARRNGNEAVDGYVFRYLLDKLMEGKNDASLSYLLKWYAPDCPDEDPQPAYIQNLLNALKICAPGNLSPDLNYLNPEGQPVNLNAVCAKNKLTMLLFWRSTCSHCKEFEPILLEIYKKYHPLGVEVYALSSDRNEETWKEALQNLPTPWVNVFIPKDQRTDIGKLFPTPSTPTLIVLDKNRRVVTRVLSRVNLEAYLDAELAKRK